MRVSSLRTVSVLAMIFSALGSGSAVAQDVVSGTPDTAGETNRRPTGSSSPARTSPAPPRTRRCRWKSTRPTTRSSRAARRARVHQVAERRRLDGRRDQPVPGWLRQYRRGDAEPARPRRRSHADHLQRPALQRKHQHDPVDRACADGNPEGRRRGDLRRRRNRRRGQLHHARQLRRRHADGRVQDCRRLGWRLRASAALGQEFRDRQPDGCRRIRPPQRTRHPRARLGGPTLRATTRRPGHRTTPTRPTCCVRPIPTMRSRRTCRAWQRVRRRPGLHGRRMPRPAAVRSTARSSPISGLPTCWWNYIIHTYNLVEEVDQIAPVRSVHHGSG